MTADVHLLADETRTSVAAVCRALEMPRSSVYARRNRPLSRRAQDTALLTHLAETEAIGELANGNHYHNRYAWIIEIKDDQVCHLREYLDTAYIMSVVG